MSTSQSYLSHLVSLLSVVVSSCMIAQSAEAVPVTWNSGNGTWQTDANWDTASQPASGDQAIVNNGSTVTVNLAGEIAGRLDLSGSSIVDVAGGGVLTLDGVSQSATFSINNGTMNITGGAVTANALVNDFLAGGGLINITAGSFSRTTGNTRLGDGATVGSIAVSGSGSWAGGLIVAVGTGNLSLSGSSAQITGVNILNNQAAGNLTVNLTPDSGGINTITASSLNLTRPDTLNFDTTNFGGAQAVDLFSYSGTLTSTFDVENITDPFYGFLSLGSDPLGDPNNLGFGEYFLDYGAGTNDTITLYYNSAVVPEPSTFLLLGLGALGMIRHSRRSRQRS